MQYHTIGDSHALFAWGPEVNKHHLGAVTCYRFGKTGVELFALRDMGVASGDCVIFCFGEIDCRCHIHNHLTDDGDHTATIQSLAASYINAISDVISAAKLEIFCCVFNVIPPVSSPSPDIDPRFPVAGTGAARKQYVQFFNACTQKLCAIKDYTFIDVYADYADASGFLNPLLSDGHVHIKDGTHLARALQRVKATH